jgi:ubiquinol-cytochrome c reductase cytochrome c subunit
LRSRLLLPGSLLAVVSAAGLAAFSFGAGAGASQRLAANPLRPIVVGGVYQPAGTFNSGPCAWYATRGITTRRNSGGPNSNPLYTRCSADGKKLTQYGNSAITYTRPDPKLIPAGERLYAQYCSSCHGATAQGGVPGVNAPNLRGVSPATLSFWVSTGRMPAADPREVQQQRKPPKLNPLQTDEVVAYVNSLLPATPFLPQVNEKGANLGNGQSLFSLNCAACHTISGAGDALAQNTYAPTLHIANAQQVAEAIRTGPANMPVFSGNLSDSQVRDITAYVTQNLQHPTNPGGNDLGGIGPVTEGFIGLLFGVGGLMIIAFWIGDRTKRHDDDTAEHA